MGEVGIIYKLMPEDIDTDLDKVVETIKNGLPDMAIINNIDIKPVAFGLKCIMLGLILDDKKGGGEDVENFLNNLEDMGSVNVVSQTLIS